MPKDTNVNFKEELAAIGVNVDGVFKEQYIMLDNKLSSLHKLPKLGRCFEDSSLGSNLDQQGAPPRKQVKVDMDAEKATGMVGTSCTVSATKVEANSK